MNKNEAKRNRHFLPPCPAYDVEGMEAWLSDLAEEGLFLVKDGFFAGFATFEPGEPRRAKYRLEAAQKSTSIWSDDGGEPDPEQVALSETYTWEYVAKRGDFYIYRSFDMEARELNTDPEVQALALNAVKKRQRGAAFTSVFSCLLYLLLFLHGGLLTAIISMRTWLFLLITAFVLWAVADEISAFVSLRRLQKKLREDGCLQRGKDWRKGSAAYRRNGAVKLILGIAALCIYLGSVTGALTNGGKVLLEDYGDQLPFATMREFADADVAGYRMTMTGLSRDFNTVREWSDLLALRCIDYNEHAEIRLADGRIIDGGCNIDYYEMRSPALARLLMEDIYRLDSRKKNFAPMGIPAVDAEYDAIYTYRDLLHFPTVLIRNGSKVIRVCFYQTSEDAVPLEVWASAAAESLAE